MSRNNKPSPPPGVEGDPLGKLFISQHQLVLASDARICTKALIGSVPQGQSFIGRPWHVWSKKPELARDLNDKLAPGGLN